MVNVGKHIAELGVTKLQEEALVEAIIAGDIGQFENLVDTYKDRVFSMAYKFTGSTDEGQDLAQEIFLLLYKNIPSFKGESSLATWIYRVALNRCLDWQRQQRREKLFTFKPIHTQQGDEWDIFNVLPSPCKTPEESVLNKEEAELVHLAIHQLSEKYQQVIILYYFQELSYQEIGIILNIPVRTVETRLYRGRQRLKEIITKTMDKERRKIRYGYTQPE